jgi:large subunit ribosomal protein L4
METTVYNVQGKEVGKMDLPALFETKVSRSLLHEVVTGYLANQRAGTHSTKNRGEVSGGGRKPWKEKGTGNARAGSNRSPLWRKGGIIFGPRPHGYRHDISQSKRSLALWMALSVKTKEGSMIVVDGLAIEEPKTKKVIEILKNLKAENGNVLFVAEKIDAKLKTASSNVQGLFLEQAASLNTYQVLWSKRIVITSGAIEKLKNRASGASEGK